MTNGAQTQPPPVTPSPDDARRIRHLMLYFGMVFVVEGIGQTDGIIAQPLIYYFKEVHSWTPVQVTAALTAFNFPWIIKPIYGLVSDFVPLFGYRRKSYLILASLVTTGAYLLATQMEAPSRLLFVLLLTAYAMAIASTLCGALLVENGQRYATSGAFVNQQWLWFHIAAMSSSLIGGLLVQKSSPAGALHGAALIAGIAPLMIVFGTLFLVQEEKRPVDLPELKLAARSLLAVFRIRSLWIVALFLFLCLSLLVQSRVPHAALLPHDRHPAFLPGLYRHPRRDLVGGLNLRRADLSALPCRAHIETPAAIEHRVRHRDHRLLRAALQRSDRSSAQFLRRRVGDDRAGCESDASRRLLSQALRRLYVRSVDVDHQPRLGALGQCRRAPLSARVQQPARAAHLRFGGVHRFRVDPYPAAAAWRQAAGARHRALIGVERRRSNRQGASEVGLSARYHFIQGSFAPQRLLRHLALCFLLSFGGLLNPRKRTFRAMRAMSAKGQKQTF